MWEPYASLIAQGSKRVETRSWATNYRGPLLIHAAKRPLSHAQEELLSCLNADYSIDLKRFHPGCIVASCSLVDCVFMSPCSIKSQSPLELVVGDWRVGRVAWILSDVKAIYPPVSATGKQGLWIPSAKVIKACGLQPITKRVAKGRPSPQALQLSLFE
nr:ASCH domain-containing protein [Iningainema tapete]